MYIKIKHEKWCYWGGLYITWMGFLGKSDENGWKPDWKSINSKRSYNSCVLFSKDDLNTASEVSRCFFLHLKKYIVREIRVLSNPQTSAVKRHWILSRPCSLPSISLHDNRRESPRRPAKGISLWFVFFISVTFPPTVSTLALFVCRNTERWIWAQVMLLLARQSLSLNVCWRVCRRGCGMNGHVCHCGEVISHLKELGLICTTHTHLTSESHRPSTDWLCQVYRCDCFSLISCCSDVSRCSADLFVQLNSRIEGGDGDLPERGFGLRGSCFKSTKNAFLWVLLCCRHY